MSKIKNSGLAQYGAEPLEQQQVGPAGVEGVILSHRVQDVVVVVRKHAVMLWPSSSWETLDVTLLRVT